MKRKAKASELEDEIRPEYDLRKLKFVGRGIYAQRYRSGTKVVSLDEGDDSANQKKLEDDDLSTEYDFSKMRIVSRGPGRKKRAQ